MVLSYVDLRGVRKQNGQMGRELADLKLQRAALAEDALEAKRLRTLLDFNNSMFRRPWSLA